MSSFILDNRSNYLMPDNDSVVVDRSENVVAAEEEERQQDKAVYMVLSNNVVKKSPAISEEQWLRMYHPDREFVVDEKYKIVKKLGEGDKAVVCAATVGEEENKVAIKKIKSPIKKNSVNMLKIMNHVNHPNLVKTLDVVDPIDHTGLKKGMCMIVEAMEIDLEKMIAAGSENGLGDVHKKVIAFQLLSGLKHLHDSEIVHRDIQPAHIVVDGDCNAKISSFSRASSVSQVEEYSETDDEETQYDFKHRRYQAPEILLTSDKSASKKSDIWAAGCVISELLSGTVVFKGENNAQLVKDICRKLGSQNANSLSTNMTSAGSGTFAEALRKVTGDQVFAPMSGESVFLNNSADALDLLGKMVQFDAANRIDVDDCLAHAYFDEVRDMFEEQPIATVFEGTVITGTIVEAILCEMRTFH